MVHLVVEEGGFHSQGAIEAPTANGHFVDGEVLNGGDGREFGDQCLVEEGELGRVFVAEADGMHGAVRRGEAVARGGVGGGASFSFGRNRPVGLFPLAREAARRRLDDITGPSVAARANILEGFQGKKVGKTSEKRRDKSFDQGCERLLARSRLRDRPAKTLRLSDVSLTSSARYLNLVRQRETHGGAKPQHDDVHRAPREH